MLLYGGFQIWTKVSEADLRHVSLNGLHALYDISILGYYGNQIIVVMSIKCYKPAKTHQTLLTNRLQETLTLAQYTQNDENIKLFGKSSPFTLKNDLFVL